VLAYSYSFFVLHTKYILSPRRTLFFTKLATTHRLTLSASIQISRLAQKCGYFVAHQRVQNPNFSYSSTFVGNAQDLYTLFYTIVLLYYTKDVHHHHHCVAKPTPT
jgi:hypothetical protein